MFVVGRVGQQIDSSIEQTSFTLQMVCARVMHLGWRLYLQQLFMILFSFIYFQVYIYSVYEIYGQMMSLSKKTHISERNQHLPNTQDWGERVFFSVTAIFSMHLRMFPLSQ